MTVASTSIDIFQRSVDVSTHHRQISEFVGAAHLIDHDQKPRQQGMEV